MAKIAAIVDKIRNAVICGYKKIERGAVRSYQAVESGAVRGFGNVMDKCVEVLFARENESVDEAKARLSGRK